MDKKIEVSSRSFGITIALILVLMSMVLIGGSLLYLNHWSGHYRKQVEDQLLSVASLKSDRLAEYMEETTSIGRFVASNPYFTGLVSSFMANADNKLAKDIASCLKHMRSVFPVDAVMLLDPTGAKLIVDSDRDERPLSQISPTTLTALHRGETVFEDFYLNQHNDMPFLKLLSPVFAPDSKNKMIAILALRIDPNQYIYPLLASWPTESPSSETLMMRRDGERATYLNNVRFKANTAMRLSFAVDESQVPAVRAIAGERGILEGPDYRGVPTIAAATEVPGSPWVLVARIDREEVLGSLKSEGRTVVGLALLLTVSVWAAMYLVWRKRKALFKRAIAVARKDQLEANNRFEALFENLGVGVSVVDPALKVVKTNRLLNQWFPGGVTEGRSRCEGGLCGKDGVVHCAGCAVSRSLKDGGTHEGDIVVDTAEGRRVLRAIATPLRGPDGRIEAAIEVLDDVTERRGLAAEISARESVLSAITGSAQDAIVMMDDGGLITFWNPAAERMFGRQASEAVGKTLHILIAPERFRAAHGKAFERFLLTGEGDAVGKTLELPALHSDGHEIDVSLSLSAVKLQGKWNAVGIMRDITQQKVEREQLRIANEQLEHANLALASAAEESKRMAREADAASVAKSQFLANMSHEIRTPMNGVIGMTGLLMETTLTPEQRRFTEVIQSSGDALLDVINDILDFSKIEADKLEMEELDFDLRNTVEDAAELLAFKAQEKELEFVCRIDPDVPSRLVGDPGRIRQVLVNLGGNAVKFTSKGEVVVDVSLVSEDERTATVRFEVRDTGIGIPPEKLGLVFRAFEQVDASTTRRYGGTGLGLAICQRIVDRMGGQIAVESELGLGSTFRFTLTLGKQPVSQRPTMPQWGDISGLRVLAVDDNATNRLVVSEQLSSWGVEVEVRSSGLEGIEVMRQAAEAGRPFDVLLTDMQMPDMDGEALGVAVKADPLLRRTQVVVLTSVGRRGDAKRLRCLGFSAYLTKPVKQSHLYECLARLVGGGFDDAANGHLITKHSLEDARRGETTVLLVEDHPTNQLVAMKILEKLGYQALAVFNGAEALQALKERLFDVVLMDVQMPVMDGFEATRRIRSGESGVLNPRVPIIAMTAHAVKGDRERCLDQGMDDYVSKPVDAAKLVEALDRCLQRPDEVSNPPTVSTPNATAEPHAAVFDREALFRRLMEDEELLSEVLEGFLDDLPSQLTALNAALVAGDLEAVARGAHTVKGAAANVGAMKLSAAALALEQAVKLGDLADLNRFMDSLRRAFEEFRKAI